MIKINTMYKFEELALQFFSQFNGNEITFKKDYDGRAAHKIDRESIFDGFIDFVKKNMNCEIINTGKNKFPDSNILRLDGFNVAIEYKTQDKASDKTLKIPSFNTTFPTRFKSFVNKKGEIVIYKVYYFILNRKGSLVKNTALIHGGYFSSPEVTIKESLHKSGEETPEHYCGIKVRRRRSSSIPSIKLEQHGFYYCLRGKELVNATIQRPCKRYS